MRVIEERWENVGFAVEQAQKQLASPEGFPMMKPDGTPDMETISVLVFVHNTPEKQWVIRVPFDAASKAKLVESLTGAMIVPATAADLRHLL